MPSNVSVKTIKYLAKMRTGSVFEYGYQFWDGRKLHERDEDTPMTMMNPAKEEKEEETEEEEKGEDFTHRYLRVHYGKEPAYYDLLDIRVRTWFASGPWNHVNRPSCRPRHRP